jgi:hypothetical protein
MNGVPVIAVSDPALDAPLLDSASATSGRPGTPRPRSTCR